MATSPSEPRFEVVGGGAPTAEEVAAMAAALEFVLVPPAEPEPVSRWRWSGRWWDEQGLDWRDSRPPAHPSRP
ncbi:MAG: hypothetical protein LC733_06730 [Actinobacteria bacterium]|nr:hypothetical protein [Actinomycetota bacterium]